MDKMKADMVVSTIILFLLFVPLPAMYVWMKIKKWMM